MTQHNNSSGGWRDDRGYELEPDAIKIRDTILMCRVEGMQTTTNSLEKIELHLASIAQSLAIIAGAQAQIAMFESEEK